MSTAYVALGSNLGDREDNLRNALKHLEENEVRVVKVYEDRKAEPEDLAAMETILQEMERADVNTLNDDRFSEWDQRMRALEKPPVRRTLRTKFIKEVLPNAYDEAAAAPVTNNIVFLQPRKGLNQSFQYIYHRIERDYPYTPRLFELQRGIVSATEQLRELGFRYYTVYRRRKPEFIPL